MGSTSEHEHKELRVVVLGRTGAGMTSTANNILFEKLFEERADTRSKTQLCESAQRTIRGRHVTVIDTPGFYNTENTNQQTECEIDRCVSMATPGPHAFLMVISMTNRFPPEAQETIRLIEAKFGRDVYRYVIVVFTGKDTFDSTTQDFTEFLRKGTHPMVQEVLRKCNDRCVAFNNRAGKEERSNQVNALLDIVDNMIERNEQPFFSTDNFNTINQRMRRYLAVSVLGIRQRAIFNLGTVPVVLRVVKYILVSGTLFRLLKPLSSQLNPSIRIFLPLILRYYEIKGGKILLPHIYVQLTDALINVPV